MYCSPPQGFYDKFVQTCIFIYLFYYLFPFYYFFNFFLVFSFFIFFPSYIFSFLFLFYFFNFFRQCFLYFFAFYFVTSFKENIEKDERYVLKFYNICACSLHVRLPTRLFIDIFLVFKLKRAFESKWSDIWWSSGICSNSSGLSLIEISFFGLRESSILHCLK